MIAVSSACSDSAEQQWVCEAGGSPPVQTETESYDTALAARRACTFEPSALVPDTSAIEHVVIVLRENRSYDHYLGCYDHPEADRPPADAHNPQPATGEDVA